MNKKTSALLTIIIVVIGLRAYAPIYLKNYINDVIDNLDGYQGHVTDVDISLLEGGYIIKGFLLERLFKKEALPYVKSDKIDISIEWLELFKGNIVSEIHITDLNITLNNIDKEAIEEKQEEESPNKSEWLAALRKLVPIKINYVDITNGSLSYKINDSDQFLALKNVNGSIKNLRNVKEKSKELPSPLYLKGELYDSANIELKGAADIINEVMLYNLDFKIEDLSLKDTNHIAKEYLGIDFNAGKFNLYSELKIDKENVKGYVKPMFLSIDILDIEKDIDEGIMSLLYETFVASIFEILQNQRKEQFASKIPIDGKRSDFHFENFEGFISVLKNAFIKPLKKKIDNTIDAS